MKAVVPFDEFATGIRGGIHDEVIADGSICRRGVIDDVARSKIVEWAVANTASNRKSVVDLPIVFNVKGRFYRIFVLKLNVDVGKVAVNVVERGWERFEIIHGCFRTIVHLVARIREPAKGYFIRLVLDVGNVINFRLRKIETDGIIVIRIDRAHV